MPDRSGPHPSRRVDQSCATFAAVTFSITRPSLVLARVRSWMRAAMRSRSMMKLVEHGGGGDAGAHARQEFDDGTAGEAYREEVLDELDPLQGFVGIVTLPTGRPRRFQEPLFLVVAQSPHADPRPPGELSDAHDAGHSFPLVPHVDVRFRLPIPAPGAALGADRTIAGAEIDHDPVAGRGAFTRFTHARQSSRRARIAEPGRGHMGVDRDGPRDPSQWRRPPRSPPPARQPHPSAPALLRPGGSCDLHLTSTSGSRVTSAG